MAGNIYIDSGSGSGDMTYAVNPYAMAKALDRLDASLVVTGLIDNYSEVAKNQGTRFSQNVRVPSRGSLTAQTKTPGTAATFQQAAVSKVDLPITTHKTIDFLVEDYGGLFDPATIGGYMTDAASTLAEAIESDVIALYASAGDTAGGVGTAANKTLIATLAKKALEAKWRNLLKKNIVWGPEAFEDLIASTELSSSTVQGGDQSTLREAYIGRFYGFDNYVSNLMPAVTGSPDAEHCMAFQSEAMGIAFVDMTSADMPAGYASGVQMQAMNYTDDEGKAAYSMRSIVGYSQTNRGVAVSTDIIYGVKVINSALLFDVTVGNY